MEQNLLRVPTNLFVDAVKMASEPCADTQVGHPAIFALTEWWNDTAEPWLRSAFSFSLYVRYGDDWLSGNPEECWVDAKTWAENPKGSAAATLLDGRITVVFYKNSIDENAYSFDAKTVNGQHSYSGGRWDGITGDGILTKDAHEALNLFPLRFPDAWDSLTKNLFSMNSDA